MLVLPEALVRAGVALRADRPSDRAFLRALYGTARPDLVFLSQWPAAERDAFLDSQFQLQDIHYRRYHAAADFLIVEQGGFPIGRLVLERGRKEWSIIDIALLPANRASGLGAAIVRAAQDAARDANRSIRLHVERGNRAKSFYERLGFVDVESEYPSHFAMLWRPS